MNLYQFQQEKSSPSQHALLDHLLPRAQKPTSRFGSAKTPEEVAKIIAGDMLESVKDSFSSNEIRALLPA
jgi:hypothetical protein